MAAYKIAHEMRYSTLRALLMLLQGGFTIENALSTWIAHTDNPQLKERLQPAWQALQQGQSLSTAFQCTQLFDEIALTALAAGEATHTLANVLHHLTEWEKIRHATHQKIQHALRYPKLIVCAALCMLIGMCVFVFPALSNLYLTLGKKLPPTLIFWNTVTAWCIAHVYLLLTGILALIYLSQQQAKKQQSKKQQRLHHTLRRWIMQLPFLTSLHHTYLLGAWYRIVYLALSTGLPLVRSVALAHPIMQTSRHHPHTYNTLITALTQGHSFAASLRHMAWAPPIALSYLELAEKTNQMPQTLQHLAEQTEQQWQDRLAILLTWLEPLLLLGLGGMLAGLLITLYVPLVNLGMG
ncbi:MAG: hypothetical protein A3J38_09165 [Gammaproteobacteria bacterium RIFCSPHIGHO2_12_FULL_45_9]|nr:MAG: hypothetical protein A3J38_09165 [Gammaproteobacteria bacterium RIFCSPHIGHO2_12_FULL_45_9]